MCIYLGDLTSVPDSEYGEPVIREAVQLLSIMVMSIPAVEYTQRALRTQV